jgi:zinc protease
MPGVKPEEVEAVLHAHLEAAAAPLPEVELDRAKNQVLSSLYEDLQVFDRRADVISELTTYFDDPHRINTEAQEYFRIAPETVADFARTYLKPQDRVVITFLPRGGDSR